MDAGFEECTLNRRCHAEASRSLTQWLFDKACLIEGHDIFRGSMPNFFMREICVVRLISMRAETVEATGEG